ncbi:hypothetical protein ACTXT7_013599 [Hymenolepis weldensis]
MADSIYKLIVCENLISLGSLEVISSGDFIEVQNTLLQMINDHDTNSIEGTASPKPLVCISFFTVDKSTTFSIIDQNTGEVIETFDASKIVYRESKCIKDNRGFIVFTYPQASPDSSPSHPKQLQYLCYVYQCSSLFEK